MSHTLSLSKQMVFTMDDAQLREERRRLEHNVRVTPTGKMRDAFKRVLASVHAETERRERRAADTVAAEIAATAQYSGSSSSSGDEDYEDSGSDGSDGGDDGDDGDESSDGAYSDGDESDSASSDTPSSEPAQVIVDGCGDDCDCDDSDEDSDDEDAAQDRARLASLPAAVLLAVVEERSHAAGMLEAVATSLVNAAVAASARFVPPDDAGFHADNARNRLARAREECVMRREAAKAEAAAAAAAASKRKRVR